MLGPVSGENQPHIGGIAQAGWANLLESSSAEELGVLLASQAIHEPAVCPCGQEGHSNEVSCNALGRALPEA